MRTLVITLILLPIIAFGQAERTGDASTLNGHNGAYYLDRSHHTGAGGGSSVWGSITGTITSQSDLISLLNGKQPIDADLTAIAALSGTNTIYYRSGSNLWSPVTIGSGLTFSSGTLAASGGGGSSAWSDITGKPTTIGGYGITDLNSLGDARWSLLTHTHTFSSLTSKPTTLSGYGITDAQPLDSDLTSIAALTTTSFGRSLITQADAAATRTTIGAGTGTVTSVVGTGTVSGLTITGTVTGAGNLTLGGTLAGDDTAYDATSWNGSTAVPTKNAVRDKIESIMGSSFDGAFSSLTGKPTTLSGYGITDAESTITTGTTSQYWRGDKSWQTLDKTAVGLGNVANTAQVTNVTGTAPIASSGGTTPTISISAATTSAAGSMSSADKTKLDAQSGSNSGDQTSVSGNAGTATALQTARTINGTSFDGTANITVTAAAGTLTGATLTSGVTASSLLSAAGGNFGTAAFTASGAYDASGAAAAAQAAAVQRSNHTGTQTISTISDATTVGANLVKATNPSAISYPKIAADNSVSFRTPAQVLGDIGAIDGSALNASNLSSGTVPDARNTVSNSTTTTLSALGTIGGLTTVTGTGAMSVTGGAGNMTITSGTGNSRTMAFRTTTSGGAATTAIAIDASQKVTIGTAIGSGLILDSNNSAQTIYMSGNDMTIQSGTGSIVLKSATGGGIPAWLQTGSNNAMLWVDADATLSLRHYATGHPQIFYVYNGTTTTNYERAKLGWSSNVLQIGTEKTGTGTARALALQTDGTDRMTIDAAGAVVIPGASTLTGTTIHGSATRLKVYTVSTLPASPTQGDCAAVSDALTPAFLTVVTGGGSSYSPVTYNGTAWVGY